MRERCNPVKTVDSLTCTKYLLFKPNLGTNITHQSHVPRYKGSVIVTFFIPSKRTSSFSGEEPNPDTSDNVPKMQWHLSTSWSCL